MRIGDLLGELGDPRVDQLYQPTVLHDEGRFVPLAGGLSRIGRENPHSAALEKYREKVPATPPVEGTLKNFSIAAYPVTNCEYKKFIENGGYNEERYWPDPLSRQWAAGEPEAVNKLLELANAAAHTHLASELAAERITLDDIHGWLGKLVRRRKPMFWEYPRFNRANQPVVGINWWEAHAYCMWQTEFLHGAGRLTNAQVLRLPTEAEWEVAARRCGVGGPFPWESGDAAQNALVRATTNGSLQRALAVGSFGFVSSRLPIYDIVGNVWEWTGSKTGPYSKVTFEQTYDTNGVDDRIARGSSWMSSEVEAAEVTFRSFDPPYNAYEDLGFRLVMFDTAQF